MDRAFLDRLGIEPVNPGACAGEWIDTRGAETASASPVDGREIARVRLAE